MTSTKYTDPVRDRIESRPTVPHNPSNFFVQKLAMQCKTLGLCQTVFRDSPPVHPYSATRISLSGDAAPSSYWTQLFPAANPHCCPP